MYGRFARAEEALNILSSGTAFTVLQNAVDLSGHRLGMDPLPKTLVSQLSHI
jgi:hypothetical protein